MGPTERPLEAKSLETQMLRRLEKWWCGFKHGHLLNRMNIGINCGEHADGRVEFFCARCQGFIKSVPMDDCEEDVMEVVRHLQGLEPNEFDVLEETD